MHNIFLVVKNLFQVNTNLLVRSLLFQFPLAR
uniref:Uncharacterized protein n=1 Tax=Rhizophora mucronata TaxID=61149 RepID=A0A2P2PYT9_RHIMU